VCSSLVDALKHRSGDRTRSDKPQLSAGTRVRQVKRALMQLVRKPSLPTSSYASSRGHGRAGVASRPRASSSAATRRSTWGCVAIMYLTHKVSCHPRAVYVYAAHITSCRSGAVHRLLQQVVTEHTCLCHKCGLSRIFARSSVAGQVAASMITGWAFQRTAPRPWCARWCHGRPGT